MKIAWLRIFLAIAIGATLGFYVSPDARAQEELVIEDEEPLVIEPVAPAEPPPAPVEEAKAPAPAPAPAAQSTPAPQPAPAAQSAPAPAPAETGAIEIRAIRVAPTADGRHIEVVMSGSGALIPRIMKLGREKQGNLKLVLDFDDALYKTRRVALGAPGLGDIRVVRGAQFKAQPDAVARVVIELKKSVTYEEIKEQGSYAIRLASVAVAEAEQEAIEGTPVPAEGTIAPAPAQPQPLADILPARSKVLHAMVTDLPDRVRLVVTADGVMKYRLASQKGGEALLLSLYDVDLSWSPPRMQLKEGPIREVRARQVSRPSRQVLMDVILREARPYHVRKDQNQVIVEVEKPEEKEIVDEGAKRAGDILHRVTLNVHNEDLGSLVKALAFEAGFDNIRVNDSVIAANRKITISLRGVRLARALNLILSPYDFVWKVEQNVLRVGRADEFDRELEADALSGASAGGTIGGGGIVTRVFRLKHISIFDVAGGGAESGMTVTSPYLAAPPVVRSEIMNAVRDILVSKTKGKVTVDARSNSLIVTDAASNMPKIEKLIRELDIQVPQVTIQARLIQLQRTDTEGLGIVWSAERATPANPELSVAGSPIAMTAGASYSLTTGMLAPGFNLDATLEVLQDRGESKVLMNPSITTLHDRSARVMTERRIYYLQSTIVPSQSGPIIQTTYVPISVPIELVVRPHVNPDNTLVMEVDIGMSNIIAGAAAGAPPNISRQSATTRLLIRSGETGVIGGMLTDDVLRQETRVPVLGSLPWWLGGGLFRGERISKEKLELVLFLTPTITDKF